MNDRQIFGEFIKTNRNKHELTVRLMAEMIGVGAGYYSDIESGRRTPIDFGFLDRIAEVLHLSDEDREIFYDLAGRARSAAPPDLTDYINESKEARIALRVAKEKASDDDWRRFVQELEQKKERENG